MSLKTPAGPDAHTPDPDGGQDPVPVPSPEAIADLVADAITAPSLHNAQPWRFRYDPDRRVVEVRADPDRGSRCPTPTAGPPTWGAPPRSSICGSPPRTRAGSP